MTKLDIMNSKEVKILHKALEEQWGFTDKLSYVFMKNDKDKIFIINRDIENIDLKKLHINSMGLYFGESKFGLRLSMEGAQLVGPRATKGVVSITDEQLVEWIKGEAIDYSGEDDGFVIIQHGTDYIGTGKAKEGKIINYVPKTRRISSL